MCRVLILSSVLTNLNRLVFCGFSTKNIGKFKILTFEILTKRLLTMSLVLNNRALDDKILSKGKIIVDNLSFYMTLVSLSVLRYQSKLFAKRINLFIKEI